MIALDELTRGTVHLDGRDQPFELAVPPAGEVLPMIMDPDVETPERAQNRLRIGLSGLLVKLDGRRVYRADAARVAADPQALGAVLIKRNALYEVLREEGRLFALCPRCRTWEAEVTIPALVVGLRGGLRDLFTPDRLLLAPLALSDPRSPGKRPADLHLAALLRFVLPSARVGLPGATASGGVLGDLGDGTAEEMAWERFVPIDQPTPEGAAHRRYGNPGFRAMLRLAVVLELEGHAEVTPEVVEALPVVDVLYLDALYHLTHFVDVPETTSLRLHCETCGETFGPWR
jgi:hypothetical protein